MTGNIRRMLQEAGFFEKVDVNCMYVSIHDAVLAAVGGESQTHPKEPCTSPQVTAIRTTKTHI